MAEAILAAKARKVRVQVILEGDYLVQVPPLADPWSLSGDNEQNRVIHSAVLRAGIDVITDLNPEIFQPGRHSSNVLRMRSPRSTGSSPTSANR